MSSKQACGEKSVALRTASQRCREKGGNCKRAKKVKEQLIK
jgi:hypothetical protein